jgi:16S rRNA (cytidine1402-2'-O)-methyltransferase
VSSTSSDRALGAGLLSVVATPIGNLDDLSVRALATLRGAEAILAEDTRRTRALCAHHGVGTKLVSFHAHTKDEKVRALVEELRAGARFALVTDAGTPVVSDPGRLLVDAAREAGVRVEAIPGPSAVTAALSVAGLHADVFRFVGFLPRAGGRRRRALEEIAAERGATVLFEAPARVGKTLAELALLTGDARRVAVCRELTKVHEEVVRGPIAEVARAFADGARGEVTIVVEGTGEEAGMRDDEPSAEDADDRARALLDEGLSARDAAKKLAEELRLGRNEAYEIVQRQKGGA